MTLRQVSKDTIAETLTGFSKDSRLTRFREALLKDSRETFTVSASPAGRLRSALVVKHRVARTHGKILAGDGDLLLRLHELGDQPVTAVAVNEEPYHYILYLSAATFKPIGVVIIQD